MDPGSRAMRDGRDDGGDEETLGGQPVSPISLHNLHHPLSVIPGLDPGIQAIVGSTAPVLHEAFYPAK
jgi:hypothetical protein